MGISALRSGVYTLTVTASGGRFESLALTQTFAVPASVAEIRRATWLRAARAAVILEHIGTPEALAVLKEMATGHPDALPTVAAKQAVTRLTAPIP